MLTIALTISGALEHCSDVKGLFSQSGCCGSAYNRSLDQEALIDSMSLSQAKIAVSKKMRMQPYSDDCPPGTSMDALDGRCYNKAYHAGALCGYSEYDYTDSLYVWDSSTGTCIRNSKTLDDADFRFYSRGALATFTDWWTSNRTDSTFAVDINDYNGYALFFNRRVSTSGPDRLNPDGTPVAAGFYKGNFGGDHSAPSLNHFATDAPYSVEKELRAYIHRYPGMLPNNGDDYFVRPCHGGGPMIGAYTMAQVAQLAERGLRKFCLLMQVPEYGAPGYIGDYLYEFDRYMASDPFWSDNQLTFGTGADKLLELKPWTVGGGAPLPTCTGSDGSEYAPGSTDVNSPWIEFMVSMSNPTGEIRQCKVPHDRCQVDAAYNYASYYHRAKLDASQMVVPMGSDGLPVSHIYYSFTKTLGVSANRWGFAASTDVDLWNKLNQMHQPFRTVYYESSVINWRLMAQILKDVALGPTSDFEMSQVSKYNEYDTLMETYLPDTCPCLELASRDPVTRGIKGAYYWIKMKDTCATMPTSEGFAPNLYISLHEYMKTTPHLMTKGRGSKITNAAKLYSADKAADPSSVWNKWSSFSGSAKSSIGEESWDRGASAGAHGSWARFQRIHVMNSDDAYVKAYLKRIGYICGVNPPDGFLGPIEAAKLDPTIVVDEGVAPGFA